MTIVNTPNGRMYTLYNSLHTCVYTTHTYTHTDVLVQLNTQARICMHIIVYGFTLQCMHSVIYCLASLKDALQYEPFNTCEKSSWYIEASYCWNLKV